MAFFRYFSSKVVAELQNSPPMCLWSLSQVDICRTFYLPLLSCKRGEAEAVPEASRHPAAIKWRTRVSKNPAGAKGL